MTLKDLQPLIQAAKVAQEHLKANPRILSLRLDRFEPPKIHMLFDDFREVFKGETVERSLDRDGEWYHYRFTAGGITFTACHEVILKPAAKDGEIVLWQAPDTK